jgi:Asp-tRNA(Asn)/Glu-tRNA(Gln) amidotransferase A subunit family amidase
LALAPAEREEISRGVMAGLSIARLRARSRAARTAAGAASGSSDHRFTVSSRQVPRYEAFNYTHCLSLAGLPVVVVPAGSQDGLPLGVQVVAQPYQEHVALAAALSLENAFR